MSTNATSNLTSRGASVLTAACLLLLASCGRDTTAPASPETAVSATAGIAANANDNRPGLIVATAPGGAAAGLAFTTQPVIELRNKAGNLVMADKFVTVALEGSTVALGGTTSVALIKGVARFTNLSIPAAGTYVLLFTGDSFAPVRVTIIVAPTTVPLTVTLAGTGKVVSSPAGIDCGATCSATFSANALVTLTASTPTVGWTFAGWTGDACSVVSSASCQLTLNGAKSVIATFNPVSSGSPVLTMTVTGAGVIAADRDVNPADGAPDTLCTTAQGTCTSVESPNTIVTLIAMPAEGSTFVGWGGACADSGTSIYCDVLMSAAQTVTAEFYTPAQLARNGTSNLTSFTVRTRTTRAGGGL